LAARSAASLSARFASPAARAPGGALAGLGARLSARRAPPPRRKRALQQHMLPHVQLILRLTEHMRVAAAYRAKAPGKDRGMQGSAVAFGHRAHRRRQQGAGRAYWECRGA